MRLLSLAALLVVAACGSSTPTATHGSPSNGVACITGSITVPGTTTGDLDSASTCKAGSESAFTAFYALNIQAGHGYLLSMSGQTLNPFMALIAASDSLRALSPLYAGPVPIARMLFTSEVTETDTVLATTFDTTASDTGAYTITAQACKVPVPPLLMPTDSVTHSDNISVGGDCPVLLSDFLAIQHSDQIYVHLYSLHYSRSGVFRQITVNASGPVWLVMGGPQDDTFGAIAGQGGVATIDTATTKTSVAFGNGAGHYTLVVGSTEPASYTLTIGTEQPYVSVTRSSKNQFRPPAALHQSTPLSVGRRGR